MTETIDLVNFETWVSQELGPDMGWYFDGLSLLSITRNTYTIFYIP